MPVVFTKLQADQAASADTAITSIDYLVPGESYYLTYDKKQQNRDEGDFASNYSVKAHLGLDLLS